MVVAVQVMCAYHQLLCPLIVDADANRWWPVALFTTPLQRQAHRVGMRDFSAQALGDGRFQVTGQPQNPALDVELLPGDGLVRFAQDEEQFELAYSDARLVARLRDDVGSAELRLGLGAGGQAQGRVSLGAARDGDRTLGGKITARFPDLSLVAGFVPALEAVEGELKVDTQLSGTLAAPRLLGGLQIDKARARVPAAGIELSDLALSVRGEGGSPLRIDGTLSSGKGSLQLDGTFDLASNAVDLRVVGEEFEAVRLPEARVGRGSVGGGGTAVRALLSPLSTGSAGLVSARSVSVPAATVVSVPSAGSSKGASQTGQDCQGVACS